jgi:H+/gluconate symporter-like permease
LVVLHTAIAIIAIVLLIVVVRVDPVISLVIGTIYLGLTAGLGFEDTVGTLAQGFGDIMAEVGLLIGFGVLLGSLLIAMGALQKLVELLLRLLGPQRLPYAFSAALSSIFPAIYVDVQLVLAAPLARSAGKVPETIAYLSTLVELRPGDLIMTGTPKGVGPVRRGDQLVGHIDGVGDLKIGYRA